MYTGLTVLTALLNKNIYNRPSDRTIHVVKITFLNLFKFILAIFKIITFIFFKVQSWPFIILAIFEF